MNAFAKALAAVEARENAAKAARNIAENEKRVAAAVAEKQRRDNDPNIIKQKDIP